MTEEEGEYEEDDEGRRARRLQKNDRGRDGDTFYDETAADMYHGDMPRARTNTFPPVGCDPDSTAMHCQFWYLDFVIQKLVETLWGITLEDAGYDLFTYKADVDWKFGKIKKMEDFNKMFGTECEVKNIQDQVGPALLQRCGEVCAVANVTCVKDFFAPNRERKSQKEMDTEFQECAQEVQDAVGFDPGTMDLGESDFLFLQDCVFDQSCEPFRVEFDALLLTPTVAKCAEAAESISSYLDSCKQPARNPDPCGRVSTKCMDDVIRPYVQEQILVGNCYQSNCEPLYQDDIWDMDDDQWDAVESCLMDCDENNQNVFKGKEQTQRILSDCSRVDRKYENLKEDWWDLERLIDDVQHGQCNGKPTIKAFQLELNEFKNEAVTETRCDGLDVYFTAESNVYDALGPVMIPGGKVADKFNTEVKNFVVDAVRRKIISKPNELLNAMPVVAQDAITFALKDAVSFFGKCAQVCYIDTPDFDSADHCELVPEESKEDLKACAAGLEERGRIMLIYSTARLLGRHVDVFFSFRRRDDVCRPTNGRRIHDVGRPGHVFQMGAGGDNFGHHWPTRSCH
jgi:hypothetical protein